MERGDDVAAFALPPLAPGECPCAMVTRDGRHALWVAFLDANNDHYGGEECGLDYMCCSSDWLTRKATGSSLKHCQVMFWHDRVHASLTIDVTGDRGCVFEASMKTFSRRGWQFVRVVVSREQELDALAFMRAQLGKPLNDAGANAFLCSGAGESGADEAYFCSELVARTLQEIGYLRDTPAAAFSPGSLFERLLDARGGVPARLDAHHVVRHNNYWAALNAQTLAHEEANRARRRPSLRPHH